MQQKLYVIFNVFSPFFIVEKSKQQQQQKNIDETLLLRRELRKLNCTKS